MTLTREWQHLLAGCDEAQHEAITTDAAPLLVVAGAGSGKTRVLTRRIAYRVAEGSATAAHVLALTFTRKAAAELRQRLAALGLAQPVTAGTFHAAALGELRRYAYDHDRSPPVILDSKARLLARLLPDRYALCPTAGTSLSGRRDVLAAVAGEIEWAKARCLTHESYAAACRATGRTPGLDQELVVTLFRAYEREKRKRRVLDLDDLLISLTQAIEQEPDFAAAQRWRYRHLFVDELQDANTAQLRLLDAWVAGRSDLCAVGDHRQAIYGWNGAEAGAVAEFADRYPGATTIRLDANYRSSPQVVAVATAALDPADRVVVPEAKRPDGSVPTLTAYESGDAEAQGVAALLRRAHRPGLRWAACAVLARTNAQLLTFEIAFDEARIPFRTGSGTSFMSRPAVRSALGAIEDPGAHGQFAAFVDDLEQDLRALDGSGHDPGGPWPMDGERDAPRGREPAERCATEPPWSELTTRERGDLRALTRLARDYCSEESRANLEGFLAWARATLRSDPSPGEADAVTLSTFHRAKGLEWSAVFVTGLEDGLVPITQARTPEAFAEERRLLYVALSRASESLHCSWARRRTFGNRSVNREPSPYLAAIESTVRALERLATPDRAMALRAIAESRALLAPDAPR